MAATIAQIKQQRAAQARKIKAACRMADTSLEKLERKLSTMVQKKKVIQAADIQPVATLYRDVVSKVTNIEREINSLGTLTGS